ncbi:hypothetical protein B0H11DRAFT_2433179 [Mycena galericulata]|nr:hypothetical protein B0H11DRAFT_2433179 [Mycena galericulata]
MINLVMMCYLVLLGQHNSTKLLIFEDFGQVDVRISEFWDKRHASSSPLWWFWTSNLKPSTCSGAVASLHWTPTGFCARSEGVCAGLPVLGVSGLFEEVISGRASYDRTRLQWFQLLNVLRSSPHLIGHIRRLHIRPQGPANATSFSDICALPFTNLRNVSLLIFDLGISKTCPVPIQQLFSLSTLRSVALECDFADPNDFLSIWTRCCPNLRNVVLDCSQGSEYALEPTLSDAITPIPLESLHIVHMNGIIPHWLQHGAYTPSIDLSVFQNLTFLHIDIVRRNVDPLRVTAPLNCLREVVLQGEIEEEGCSASELLAQSRAPAIFSTTERQGYHYCAQIVQIRYGDYDSDWFQRHANML